MAVWDKSTQLWIDVCCQCKTRFGMSDEIKTIAMSRNEAFSFYCPNGHQLHYPAGETMETKLRRECDRLKQDLAYQEDMRRQEREARETAERRAAGYKGVATKMKNRIKAGACPCCNRTFQDLARHIASKHPDIDNVVNFDAAKGVA